MDPLSVIAGVLGIVSVAAQSSKVLYELIDAVRTAPTEITNISRDTHAFYSILFSLESSLKDSKIAAAIAEDEGLTALVGNLREPLGNCTAILGQLMLKIQGFVRPLDAERWRFSSNDLKWWVGRKEILELTARVEATKVTLNTGLTAVGTLCNIRLIAVGSFTPKKPIRRGSGDTDAGFALRRFVEEKETASQYASSISPPSPPIETFGRMRLSSDTTLPGTEVGRPGDQVIDKIEQLRRAENQRNALLTAARQGDGLLVEVAIAQGADINAKGPEGKAAIHYAAMEGYADIVQLLIEYNANVNIKTNPQGDRVQRKFQGGRTALHWAAQKGHEKVAHMLIDSKADINAKNDTNRTPLQEAIMNIHTSLGIARLLLKQGASVTIYDDEGWTLLHQAAEGGNAGQGNAEIINALIDKGCDVEAKTFETTIWGLNRFCRATPLFLAAANGKEAGVRALLARGANPHCRNVIGETPLHVACWRGFPTIVRIMLDTGIDIEEKDLQYEETPLLKAASTGQMGVLRLLVGLGANLDAETQWGRNALQHAQLHRKEGNEEAVHYLNGVYEKRAKRRLEEESPGEAKKAVSSVRQENFGAQMILDERKMRRKMESEQEEVLKSMRAKEWDSMIEYERERQVSNRESKP